MTFLIAAYGVVFGSLAVYALRLRSRRAALLRARSGRSDR